MSWTARMLRFAAFLRAIPWRTVSGDEPEGIDGGASLPSARSAVLLDPSGPGTTGRQGDWNSERQRSIDRDFALQKQQREGEEVKGRAPEIVDAGVSVN